MFHENVGIAQVLDIERHRKTTLTEYFPGSFTWNNATKKWAKRRRGVAVERLYIVSPTAGKRYFLQMFLTVVKGATSLEDLRIVNGRVYQTFKVVFKAVVIARDMYDSNDKWDQCL